MNRAMNHGMSRELRKVVAAILADLVVNVVSRGMPAPAAIEEAIALIEAALAGER